MIPDLLVLAIFPLAMGIAAATDLCSMTMPNWIAGLLVAGFVLAAHFGGLDWNEAGLHLGLAVGALMIWCVLFSFGWIGGGDAKLFAAICLWVGPAQFLTFAVYAGLLGGALTALILCARALPLPAVLHGQGWIARLHSATQCVPYGVALAGAGLIVYPDIPFMAGLAFS